MQRRIRGRRGASLGTGVDTSYPRRAAGTDAESLARAGEDAVPHGLSDPATADVMVLEGL